MDPTYTTYSFENGTTVIVNPSMDGDYIFQEGNLAAEMLMAVCQESNFGIPIRIDVPDDSVPSEQQEEKLDEDSNMHTLDMSLIEAVEGRIQYRTAPIPRKVTSKPSNSLKIPIRKRRSRPPDPYHDLLIQMKKDINRVHANYEKQGDRICSLLSEIIENVKLQ